jgi:hypothetical protein
MGATGLPGAADAGDRRIARLTPRSTGSVDVLLGMSLGLDVWERHDDGLIVAASEAQLAELERRHLAWVERLPDAVGRDNGVPDRPGRTTEGDADDGPDRQGDVPPTLP